MEESTDIPGILRFNRSFADAMLTIQSILFVQIFWKIVKNCKKVVPIWSDLTKSTHYFMSSHYIFFRNLYLMFFSSLSGCIFDNIVIVRWVFIIQYSVLWSLFGLQVSKIWSKIWFTAYMETDLFFWIHINSTFNIGWSTSNCTCLLFIFMRFWQK